MPVRDVCSWSALETLNVHPVPFWVLQVPLLGYSSNFSRTALVVSRLPFCRLDIPKRYSESLLDPDFCQEESVQSGSGMWGMSSGPSAAKALM